MEIFCENDRSHVYKWEKDLTTKDLCVKCGGSQRVNVVWFSEPVLHLEKIQKLAASSDLFISVGTSNQIFPANSLVKMFRQMNKPTVELNLEKTINSDLFDYGIYDKPATLSVVEFKNMLIQDK